MVIGQSCPTVGFAAVVEHRTLGKNEIILQNGVVQKFSFSVNLTMVTKGDRVEGPRFNIWWAQNLMPGHILENN